MTKAAALKSADVPFGLIKAGPKQSAFIVTGRQQIALRAGTRISIGDQIVDHAQQMDIFTGDVAQAGTDYVVKAFADGRLEAVVGGGAEPGDDAVTIGGFHYAPGGNSTGVTGGDDIPAINPFSCWDKNFRPACDDPRGMVLIDDEYWCDIYLTAQDHAAGTSRYGVEIADGKSPPTGHSKFDFATAVAVLAEHGKQLMSITEGFAALYGGTERTALGHDPKVTGLDAPRTSRNGIMQPFGNLWIWVTDGHPDIPRASILGGSWISGSNAGSRYAALGYYWPENSDDDFGARGRSDHLILA